MSKPFAIYLLIAFAPAALYRMFRPPRWLSPDVRNYGKVVGIISTTLLRQMMALCGASLALNAYLHDLDQNDVAIVFLIIGVVFFVFLAIPGVISFLQFYDLDKRK